MFACTFAYVFLKFIIFNQKNTVVGRKIYIEIFVQIRLLLPPRINSVDYLRKIDNTLRKLETKMLLINKRIFYDKYISIYTHTLIE